MLKRSIKYIFISISVFLFSVVFTSSFLLFWKGNYFDGETKYVYISKGDNLNIISEKFFDSSVIYSKQLFKWAGILLSVDKKIKTGKYEIRNGASNINILNIISDVSLAVKSNVTLYEGFNSRRMAGLLKKQIGIDSITFMDGIKNTSLISINDNSIKSLEGFLIPDTYDFEWQTDENLIIERLTSEFNKFFVDSLTLRMRKMKLNLNEVVTMASIVEGETKLNSERAIVAGVYYNRIKKRMRLEADPTIQYILIDGPRRLYYSDLKINSPFNTYLNYGLPPSPINNPSRESILAALYPAQHKYLYFVADGKGGHVFAKNFEEHKKNVSEYRKILKSQIN